MGSRITKLMGVLAAVALISMLAEGANEPPPIAIPAGSVLHVKLTTTLTSKTNKSGDKFTGKVAQPIMVNGQEVIPKFSFVEGHVAFVKPAGRIKGKAEMRIIVDKVVTPDEDRVYPLSSSLEDTNSGPCAKTKDDEGTIEGCGKSKKDAVKGAAIGAGLGAAGGLTVGLASRGGCDYYGCYPSSGPGVGTSVGAGAGIGAGSVLIYHLLRHEKEIVLVEGTELTFVVNRTTEAKDVPQAQNVSHP